MTKIYAVRDRLLDFFMPPFLGPSTKQVLASLAQIINGENSEHPLAKKPQHFEIFCLGEVNENGDVKADKEFLCDATSLIRNGLRIDGTGGSEEGKGAHHESSGDPPRSYGGTDPYNSAHAHEVRPKAI